MLSAGADASFRRSFGWERTPALALFSSDGVLCQLLVYIPAFASQLDLVSRAVELVRCC